MSAECQAIKRFRRTCGRPSCSLAHTTVLSGPAHRSAEAGSPSVAEPTGAGCHSSPARVRSGRRSAPAQRGRRGGFTTAGTSVSAIESAAQRSRRSRSVHPVPTEPQYDRLPSDFGTPSSRALPHHSPSIAHAGAARIAQGYQANPWAATQIILHLRWPSGAEPPEACGGIEAPLDTFSGPSLQPPQHSSRTSLTSQR